MSRRSLTDEQRAEILRAYASLRNIGRTANLLGRGYTTVRAVLREGVAVTVDCDDGWRRYVDPTRLRPELRLVRDEGGGEL